MNSEPDIVATLKFSGKRFRNGAFDLTAVGELERFQGVVLETAKFLWRKANPGSPGLPSRFDERISLCFRGTEAGGSVVPIEYLSSSCQHDIVSVDKKYVTDSIDLAYKIISAIDGNQLVPKGVTRKLLAEYKQLGKGLDENEVMAFAPPHKPFVELNSEFKNCLASRLNSTYEDVIDIYASVYKVNMKKKSCLFASAYGSATQLSFNDEHTKSIIKALSKYRTHWVRIRGRGQFNDEGKLEKVISVAGVTYETAK